MRKVSILAAALLFAVSMQGAEPTVDEILAKNAEAKGGIDKLRSLQAVRFSGKMNMGGMEAPFSMTKKRPDNMRVEFTIQGLTGAQAFDGKNGWLVMPFMGKTEPEAMSGDMLKDVMEQADFDGPFIDTKKKGHDVALLGTADVEGTRAYKLKLSRDGNDTIVYIDAGSFLDIKAEAKRKVQGQEMESETSYGKYQAFGGLLFPTSIEMKAKGMPGGQSITIEKVELNPELGDDIFTMPAVKATAEAKKP